MNDVQTLQRTVVLLKFQNNLNFKTVKSQMKNTISKIVK